MSDITQFVQSIKLAAVLFVKMAFFLSPLVLAFWLADFISWGPVIVLVGILASASLLSAFTQD